ncbi:hypothetical protein [Thalassospira sp. MCCC 1A01428]|jgi:hypothetical protein|uniref:hypothetical protein n=1 Tax=unclassified Thalassospira TaxID=2648997 RepID=UPI000A1F21E1|nr:hypothetical protein [Thalassospira sp. MCCC 1A01428]OSQ41487.1 hypothetical protein THS27_18975 [Thalassospira sp. MCCC 1A01428]
MAAGPVDLGWWLTMVELPALAALFWLIWRSRVELQRRIDVSAAQNTRDCQENRDGLAAFKLDVARNYVSIPYLKDVERRLTAHLLRIEAKLEHRDM